MRRRVVFDIHGPGRASIPLPQSLEANAAQAADSPMERIPHRLAVDDCRQSVLRDGTVSTLEMPILFDTPLTELRTGKASPFGPRQVPSAIAKMPRHDSLFLSAEGLDGDEQGDRRHHGGPEKAIHHYAADHYLEWRREIPQAHDRLTEGGFGENFVTNGWTEAEICIGDIVRVGSATLQVSQARQPCWKLNVRFGVPDMALRVQRSLRTGWYYRVLEPGRIAAGDNLRLIDRPHPGWPLLRLLSVLYVDRLDYQALEEMAQIPALAMSWRSLAQNRLTKRSVENWSKRLTGSESA